jgi:hypothetical protein
LICPADALKKLFSDIENKTVSSIEEINSVLTSIHQNYYSFEWSWAYDSFKEVFSRPLDEFSVEDLKEVIIKWKESVLKIDEYLFEDAKKEFSLLNMTGFGIDGGEEDKHLDFGTVRGKFDTNPMVVSITEHIEKKNLLGNSMLELLNKYKTETIKA